MKSRISNSVVATDNSTISNAKITSSDNSESNSISNSIVAKNNSSIDNASINIHKEKRKSFWNGFSIGSVIASLIASSIWYLIQRIIE